MKHFWIFVTFIFLAFSFYNCNNKFSTPTNTVLAITQPTDNSTVYGDVNIEVKVYDSSISKVVLLIDSSQKSQKQSSPYNFTFDFSPYDGKTVTVYCIGYDSNGNKVGKSNQITLKVDSSGHNDPNPQ